VKIEHPQICCKYHQISAALYEKMPQKRAFFDMSDILGHPSGTSPNKTDDLGSGKKLVAKDGHGAVLGIRVLGFPSSDCHLLFQWGNHRTKRCFAKTKIIEVNPLYFNVAIENPTLVFHSLGK